MQEATELSVSNTEITPAVLREMDGWRPALIAEVLDLRMRELESFNKRSFIETGLICNEMQDKGLYTELCDKSTGECFSSMNDWLSKAAPMSRSSCFHSMRCLKELKDINLNDLSEMSRSNVSTMLFLSTDVRKNPEVIKAAKTESDKGFRQKIQKDYPDQAIECFDRIVFNFETSQRKAVESALDMAKRLYGVESNEAAEEVICSYFADGICELRPDIILTNREAAMEVRR